VSSPCLGTALVGNGARKAKRRDHAPSASVVAQGVADYVCKSNRSDVVRFDRSQATERSMVSDEYVPWHAAHLVLANDVTCDTSHALRDPLCDHLALGPFFEPILRSGVLADPLAETSQFCAEHLGKHFPREKGLMRNNLQTLVPDLKDVFKRIIDTGHIATVRRIQFRSTEVSFS